MQQISTGEFIFIVGSPRSGTTLLGEILDTLPDVAQWYEPYFIWDRHFRNHPHDERTVSDATDRVARQIRTHFLRYRKDVKCPVLVDKSPRNSLKIPFIRTIFPEARFIHLLRDGRDVVLSIHREWRRRIEIAEGKDAERKFDHAAAAGVIRRWLKRQPFWADRIRALWFETGGHLFDRSRHLNRLRWGGHTGWGPKFRGWDTYFRNEPLMRFNARQWHACVDRIDRAWGEIAEDRKLVIRYEDLLTDPEAAFEKLGRFIGTRHTQALSSSIQKLKRGNFNKWKTEMSQCQAEQIHDIVSPMLMQMGYETDPQWHRRVNG
jgi:hypothetical protein